MTERQASEKIIAGIGSNGKSSRDNLVIGLTGPFGSGCSETRKILEERGFTPFRISDEIREEVKTSGEFLEKGKLGWRKILQKHGGNKRRNDIVYWVKKVISKIDSGVIGSQPIVIDGLRNIGEVHEFRKFYPKFFLVAVCAEKDVRWKRIQADYQGNWTEFDQDDRRDQNEETNWGQTVQKCVDDCDYVFYNNENFTVSQEGKESPNIDKIKRILNRNLEDFVPLMEATTMLPEQGDIKHRLPRPDEVQIAAAYAQSNSSSCIKRHVGAVITVSRGEQNFPILMGFNENPPGVASCFSEGACYKDEDMIAKLKVRGQKIHCVTCGTLLENLQEPWTCSCGTCLKSWFHPNRNMELCTAIHAEERAIFSLSGRSAKDGTLYVTTFPCFQCSRLILDAEIKKIVYVEAYPITETTVFLKAAGVEVIPFSGFTARAFFRVFPKVN